MVGLVIVSHSLALARALVELVQQVAQQDLPIAYAAGAGDGHRSFGTDAVEIARAIEKVASREGVVVLMDLGSAILSAELAIELLPPEIAAEVRFCAAPLVEGAIAAGVQISLGSDRDTVCAEAERALLPKAEQLGAAPKEGPGPASVPAAELSSIVSRVLTLKNQYGLHARPAARFVQTAASFNADIQVRNVTTGKGPVSAKSLNALATLGAVGGHEIEIIASGPEAEAAVAALEQLVMDRFGEAVEKPATQGVVAAPEAPPDGHAILTVPVSEGVALGPLFHFQPPPPPVPQHRAENPDQEWRALERAVKTVQGEIHTRRQQVQASLGENQAAIFDAHALILEDPDLLDRVRKRIYSEQGNAAQAWAESITEVAAGYRALDNPYLRQRALDVEDVGNQVLYVLAGAPGEKPIQIEKPVILVAQDLTPTQTAHLDTDKILGLVTVGGGPTSHSAILARARGIPAVAGANASITALPDGTPVGVDAFRGLLWIEPSPEKQKELQVARETWLQRKEELLSQTHLPATTVDGHRIEVAANVGSLKDAEAAVRYGAEAVGLLRTEFLFLTRTTPPDEEEQASVLRRIGETMGDRPVIVRTLDVGGDKPLPYIEMPEEANPFLGVRAIRLSLAYPELFITQLRAVLQAGHGRAFRLMYPMVNSLREIQQANNLLETAHETLVQEGRPHLWPIETGIMIETPAAALQSRLLASEVNFFSIGTNDLTHYTLAAERGNPQLAEFSDALEPAVLRLIREVASAAHEAGKWAGVCGELAGEIAAVPILIGLGIDELSMNPAAIPEAKAIIRKLQWAEAQTLAEKALNAESAVVVRQISQTFLDRLR